MAAARARSADHDMNQDALSVVPDGVFEDSMRLTVGRVAPASMDTMAKLVILYRKGRFRNDCLERHGV